jgi:hypothetical protein
MKRCFVLSILIIFVLSGFGYGEKKFELIQKYTGDQIFGMYFFDAVVDKDGDLIAGFSIPNCMVINEKGMSELGPIGQGPGDLDGYYTIFILDNNDLVVEGAAGKLKVFEKKNGKYTWKKTIWKQIDRRAFLAHDSLFYDGKWYFSGLGSYYGPKSKEFKVYYLKVYSAEGKFIKNMVEEVFPKPYKYHHMDYYLALYKNKVYLLTENRLHLRIISPTELKVEREVKLETPDYYKPIPKDYYAYPEKFQLISDADLRKEQYIWKTSYSRIVNALIEGHWLVIQIRTCSEKMKRFALLFYNADNFKLEQTIFTDDFLLASRDGKYYFFKNGNPSYDEEADEAVINIYRFKDEKDKK